MLKSELNQHGVDCSNLDTMAAAGVADLGGLNVVLPIRLQEAKRAKPLEQLTTRPGPCKAL